MRHLLLTLPCWLIAAFAHGGPFSDLIVFGDSLSDGGNTDASTLGVFPGTNYFDGRFSNGPTYAERLSEGLGLGPLTRSGAGGDNFAFGGAETDGPGGFNGLFLNSLVEQVDTYLDRLGSRPADPDALHVVFIGANNLLDGQTDTAGPAGDVLAQLGRLAEAGARRFLGINLPLLGLTPRFNGDASLAAARTATTVAFNDALDTAYDAFESANPDAVLARLDVETLFDDLLDRADELGFTNTTGAGRDASGGSLDGSPGYVFWDDVHPTREAHALLGEAAIRSVLPEGDYNRDGEVTVDDYLVWQDLFGNAFDAEAGITTGLAADGNGDGRVDMADYTIWRDAFATQPGTLPLAIAVDVPEPMGCVLILSILSTFLTQRRGRL